MGLTSIDRVPALLLAGEVSTLRDDFKVEMVGDESKRSFRLLPKKGSSEFREIRLKFINGEVHQLALLDAMGQQIVVEFGELLINSGYDPGAFTFQVPPGVDVLEDY